MPTSGRNDRLFNLCCCVIAVVLVHLSQQAWVTAHERSRSPEVVLTLAPVTPRIIVPEPDPALYGHLLLDRALARVRLVSLGD